MVHRQAAYRNAEVENGAYSLKLGASPFLSYERTIENCGWSAELGGFHTLRHEAILSSIF